MERYCFLVGVTGMQIYQVTLSETNSVITAAND
jgi:hypothetical protein